MVNYGSMNKEDVAKAVDSSARKIGDVGTQVKDKTADTVKHFTDNVKNFDVNDVRDNVMDRVDDVRSELDRNVDHVKSGIREHPLESVVIAVGAGMFAGAILALMGRHTARKSMRTERQ